MPSNQIVLNATVHHRKVCLRRPWHVVLCISHMGGIVDSMMAQQVALPPYTPMIPRSALGEGCSLFWLPPTSNNTPVCELVTVNSP